MTKETITSESGHWYAKDGTPMYEIVGKNGNLRNTTLRDARQLGLVPSVTEIIKVSDKPALTRWLVDQAYLAMATLPAIEGETIDDRIKRAKIDAGAQANNARDLGTEIHASLERFFKGQFVLESHRQYCYAVRDKLNELLGDTVIWDAEKSFSHSLGYGGKIDLSCSHAVIDFKSKDFDESKLPEIYDEHRMQLSAYANGLNIPNARKINIFVSTKVPGLVHAVEHEQDSRPWEMFACLLQYWKLVKKFDPSFERMNKAA